MMVNYSQQKKHKCVIHPPNGTRPLLGIMNTTMMAIYACGARDAAEAGPPILGITDSRQSDRIAASELIYQFVQNPYHNHTKSTKWVGNQLICRIIVRKSCENNSQSRSDFTVLRLAEKNPTGKEQI